MDVQKFRKSKLHFDKGMPFPKGIDHNFLIRSMTANAKPEHAYENIGEGMSDQLKCSCGWQSHSYWDGVMFAFEDWAKHVAEEIGLAPKQCPCGKPYIPADGGKPCHELHALDE